MWKAPVVRERELPDMVDRRHGFAQTRQEIKGHVFQLVPQFRSFFVLSGTCRIVIQRLRYVLGLLLTLHTDDL